MEQEVMRVYSSSPPPIDGESVEEEDDDEFGDSSGGVASVKGVSLSSSQPCSLTTDLTPLAPTTEHFAVRNPALADARRSNGTLPQGTLDLKETQAMDQPPPNYTASSGVGMDRSGLEVKALHYHCDLPDLHLTNGLFEQHYQGTISTGPVPAGLGGPIQDPGFADFSVFTEPDMEAWRCSLSHTRTTEHRKNRRRKESNLTSASCEGPSVEEDTEQEPGGETDPLRLAEQEHCTPTGLDPVPPSQGLAGLSAPQERLPAGGEALGGPGEYWNRAARTRWHGTLSSLTQDPELGAGREEDDEEEEMEPEESVSSLPSTVSGSVSEEFASFCEAVFQDALEELGDFAEAVFAPSSPGEEEDKHAEKEEEIMEKEGTKKEVQQSNLRENPKTEDVEKNESSVSHKGLADSDQDNPDLTQTNPDQTQINPDLAQTNPDLAQTNPDLTQT